MKDKLLQMRAKVTQTWNQMSKVQRIGLISGAALLVLVLVFTIYNLSRTEYSYAFTDLDASDAAAITAYLQEKGIDYKLSSDGRSIGVPSTVATQVKIDVESQGLIQNGSIGFGIFRENMSSLGMTDNEFQVLKTDALAGEIQKLIQGLDGVQKAKVIIHVPEDSVFLRTSEEPSKASALVTFKPGFKPDQNLIDTIYNLVAHSLPNISMENIYVSDQRGELLPSSKLKGSDNNASAITEQFAIKRQFENDIERNVQNMLGRVFPPDKIAVSVVATLNFDKKNSVEQLVRPVDEENNKGIEISVEKIQETYSGTDGSQGVAGTGETDIPGYSAAGTGGNSESESLTERINYDVNRISNEIISAPFQVKDLTINVAVEPPVKDDPSSLTDETKEAIQTILTNIVATSLADSGRTFTDEELAKKVFVFAHSFDGMEEEESPSIFSAWYLFALAGFLAGLLIVGGVILFRRRKKPQEVEELPVEPVQPPPEPVIDLESVQNEHQVRKQLENLAKKKPEEFVNLLRTWLVDE